MNKIRALGFLLVALLPWITLAGCVQNTRPPTAQSSGYIHTWYWTADVFPISVYVDRDMNLITHREIEQAINDWNVEVGYTVFVYAKVDIETVIITGELQALPYGEMYVFEKELGRLQNGNVVLGLTTRYPFEGDSGRISSCHINLDDDLAFGDVYLVMLHELGHALGLPHTTDSESIMYNHALDSDGTIMRHDSEFVQMMIHARSR